MSIKHCAVLDWFEDVPASVSFVRSYEGRAQCMVVGSSLTGWEYVQVLKDAQLKAAYDKHLEGTKHGTGVFVSIEVCTYTPSSSLILIADS